MKQILLGLLLKYATQLFESIKTKHEAALKAKVEKRLDDLFKVVDKDKAEQVRKAIASEPLLKGGWVINKGTGQGLEDYKGIIGTESVMSKDIINQLNPQATILTDSFLTGNVPFLSAFTVVPRLSIKKLYSDSQLPVQGAGNAGYDLFSYIDVTIPPGERRLIDCGIAVAIPEGYYMHISDRSGMAFKNGGHCLGKIVDETYRGSVGVVLLNTDKEKPIEVKKGDRPAQFVLKKYERFPIVEVTELPESQRNEKGFGSSGK